MSAVQSWLLDTHVWFWLLTGNHRKLSAANVEQLEAAAARSRLLVSIISVWEIALLDSRGRLELSVPVERWIREACAQPEFELTDISLDAALDSIRLPAGFHADPADRFLVATARTLDAVLITRDDKILQYGKAGHVRVLKM